MKGKNPAGFFAVFCSLCPGLSGGHRPWRVLACYCLWGVEQRALLGRAAIDDAELEGAHCCCLQSR
jgi:hypothetical protein